MTTKIAIVGPESTGKTSLTQALADHFKAPFVEEYAVEFLDHLERPYRREDLIDIAEGQSRLEDQALQTKPKLLFCDTNLVVVKIWSDFKYGICDPTIIEMMNARNYALHLLTKPDLTWQDAKHRENPHDLDTLFELYHGELIRQQVSFKLIEGQGPERLQRAIAAVDQLGIA